MLGRTDSPESWEAEQRGWLNLPCRLWIGCEIHHPLPIRGLV